ncbi:MULTISPECIES: PKD-like domain-containing protein [Flavobacterium]|uniref:PKD-like domain-containing protein n=1 Tax=Flavobacterium TaxID=237 RepID=UPI001FCAB34D|nr:MULTISPECIES: PKD-like domain-containing protein [Flavobacterium]UOK41304.1 T9SS type B sorting domain-containing protein [Flavobacterium enshiense]
MNLKTLKVKSSTILCSAVLALTGLTSFSQSPGGVSANLTLWLKADNPATITGSPVQAWSTSGGSAAGYSVTQGTVANRPTLINGATNYTKYNYNPNIKFTSGSSTRLFKTGGSPDLLGNNGTAIIVTTQAGITGFSFYSGTTGRYQLKPDFRFQTGLSGTGYTFDWGAPTEYSTTSAAMIASYGCASNAALRKNSVQVTTPNNTATLYNPSITTGLYLGANNTSEYCNSSIAEVILFNAKPTIADMDRIESYLAIKYGITRGGNTNTAGTYNYIASDGITILWSKVLNTGFNNDIAVIGRDDNSGLAQKQSISVNNGEALTISLGNGAIPTENATNSAAFSSNLSFLAWGNNGLTKAFNTGASKPTGVLERLNRIWKTNATNFSQQTTFGFENAQITGLGTTGNLCLLFDEDGTDFSNAVVVAACSAVNTGTRTEFRGINIPAGKPYFTLARMVTPTLITNNGPICEGTTLNLTAETMTPSTTYSWTGPNGFTSTDQNPSIPSITAAGSGTYSVTITTSTCTTVLSTPVTVTPAPAPTFTPVGPICSGDTLAPLPTTSNEGVTGTWSPALDNTLTTTYTFTPTTGLCSGRATMIITVNPVVTPTFTQVAPICSGGTLAALPTTSDNGITGSWSPALDNTTTTNYIFTPDAWQCASTTPMTITVNPVVTPAFTQVAPICSGGTMAALPTTSDNGITGSWSPALDNTTTTNYIFTPDAGQCASTAPMTITVNQLPTISGTSSVCNGSKIQLIGSGTAASTNAWTSSDNSVAIVDANGWVTGVSAGPVIITFTDINGCSATANVDVLVTPTANISVTGAPLICTGTASEITITGTPDATVNYTINGTPASVTIPASGFVAFSTGDLSAQTIYQLVNVTTTSGCTSALFQSADVNIAPQPTASISPDTTVCSNSSTDIKFEGTAGATVSYTVNSGAIQTVILDTAGTATVNTGNLTADATYTLVNAIAGTTPNCIQSLTGSSTVAVVQRPAVTATPTSQTLCSGQSTGIRLEDTVPNTTFTWTYAQTGGVTGASNGSGNIISQVLTAGTTTGTVTYTITPSSSSNCAGTPTTVTVTVNPVPDVNVINAAPSICTENPTNITMSSTIPGATFSWNATQTGGVTGAASGTGTSINQVLTAFGTTVGQVVYTIIPDNSGCMGTPKTVIVTVYPKPKITASPSSAILCSGEKTNIMLNSNVPGTVFNWSVMPDGVLGAVSDSGNTISQTLTTAGSTPGTVIYTITPTANGCTGEPITVTVTVNPTPEIFSDANPPAICSGDSSGITVTPAFSGTSISWTVVQNGVKGAFDGSGSETSPGLGIAIDQILTTTGNVQGTVVYTITPMYNGCAGDPKTVTVLVNPTPKINIQEGSICIDATTGALIYGYTMDTGLSEADYSFQWYFENNMNNVIATTSSYVATEAGTYTVSIMNSSTGCSDVFIIKVEASNPATTATAVVTNYFEDTQAITVTVAGNGSYLYSLDGGAFQESNVFVNVLPGEHTVTIQDAAGCTNITLEHIVTIGYPRFFTPNGDGFNDTWNIWSLSNDQPNAEIHIYDRYGKLIKQIVPSGTGWDGLFNGQTLPSTDYWFTVKYKENGAEKLFKAHFSMRR